MKYLDKHCIRCGNEIRITGRNRAEVMRRMAASGWVGRNPRLGTCPCCITIAKRESK